jgi:hypothetical protein
VRSETSAERKNAVNAIVALNSWSVSISSVSDRSANHPTFRLAAQRGHGRHEQHRRRRAAELESPRDPPDERGEQEQELTRVPHREHGGTEQEREHEQRLGEAAEAESGLDLVPREHAQQERRHHEDPHRVARPPHGPRAPEPVELDRDDSTSAAAPDRRADRHAQQRAETHERHDVADAVDLLPEAGPLEQPGRQRSARGCSPPR